MHRATRIALAGTILAYGIHPSLGACVGALAGLRLWLGTRNDTRRPSTSQGLVGLAAGVVSGIAAVVVMDAVRTEGFHAYVDPFTPIRQLSSALPFVVGATIAISAVNAVAEEWLFRGFVLQRLVEGALSRFVAVALSSLSFGAAHIATGLPGGFSGFLLTLAFGALVGTVYARNPEAKTFVVTAHFAADAVIIGHLLLLRP